MAPRFTRYATLTLLVLLAKGQACAGTKTIARCGAGFLEEVDGVGAAREGHALPDGVPAGGPAS